MPKIKKRTLWGYSSASVDEVIQAMQSEHEEKCAALQKQLEELELSNKALRTEIGTMRDNFLETPDHEGEVAAMLMQAHVEQSKAVYAAYLELQEVEQKQEEVLEISELRRESVMAQVLDKLRHLESAIERNSKEGERGRSQL
ncbi:MAG: hypothetical protein ACXVDJ_05095 [Tumebacillaceae bacterium]